jgi:pimeloyl-ACP methyl ester carboxylesterase
LKLLAAKIIGNLLNGGTLIAPKSVSTFVLKLFSKPRKSRSLPLFDIALKDAQKEYLLTNGIKTPLYKYGNGKNIIILLHGWDSNAARWKKLIHHLDDKKSFTFIAIDSPGHGASEHKFFDVCTYATLINKLVHTYKPIAVIGHSIGGLAAIKAMALHYSSNKNQLHKPLLISMGAPHSLLSIFETYFKIFAIKDRLQSYVLNSYMKKYGESINEADVGYIGDKVLSSCLIIHDERDVTNPVVNAHLIHKHLPNSKLLITDISDHRLQNPTVYKLIMEAVYDFLD